MDEDIVRRLDRLIAILMLAHRPAIESAKTAIRHDPVNAQILDETAADWMKSGDLQRRVSASTGAATRTVRLRLADLLSQQAIEQRGGGHTTEYRATGLL